MLTLKQPIQLHTIQPLTVASDSFFERIMGNYEIMGAKFEAKDLLYLMTAPAELPEDLGGMTTLVEDNSFSNVQNVSMEVINNVVNRILLDGTNNFTYQDQVYITTVLNRMGITNVAQFIKEVRRLRVENESVVKMTQLYQDQITALLTRQAEGEELPKLPAPETHEDEDTPVRRQDPATELSMSILNRLQLPRTYQTVHAFKQNWSVNNKEFQDNTLRLTEQLRFSNAIQLAEMKQQVFQEPNITLLNHWNRYEHYDFAEPASTEEQVLRQAAAAALLTCVDNTMVEVLNSPNFQQQWLQVGNSLWQTAENTINRFESYHSWEGITAPELPPSENQQWNYYASELQQFRNVEQYFEQFTSQPPLRREPMDMQTLHDQLKLQYLDQPEKADELYEEEMLRAADAILNRVNEPEEEPASNLPRQRLGTDQEGKGPLYAPELTQKSVLEQVLRRSTESQSKPVQSAKSVEGKTPFELSLEFLQEGDQTTVEEGDTLVSSTKAQKTLEHTLEETLLEQSVRENTHQMDETFHTHVESRADRLLREILPHLTQQQRVVLARETEGEEQRRYVPGQAPAPVERQFLQPGERVEENTLTQQERITQREQLVRETMDRVYGENHQAPESTSAEPTPPVKPGPGTGRSEEVRREFLTVAEAEEMAPELLTREMERIDRQNRETVERVSREIYTQPSGGPVVSSSPDMERTMRDSLQALTDPMAVLSKLPIAPAVMEKPMTYTPEEQALLSQAKPEDRAFYETVLAVQKNPEAAMAQGLIKEPSMGSLQAELKLGNLGARSPLELFGEEHVNEARQAAERSEAVMEHIQRVVAPGTTLRETLADQPASVRIVHKEAPPDLTEELIQRLQENRTQQINTENTVDQVYNNRIQTTDLRDIENHVVNKSTQDVTELVNRTLARQMRTISEQVYQQMERKLQLERSRRGRF